MKKLDVSCLFRAGSVKSVEIGGQTYYINASGMAGKSLYSGPRSTKTKTAKYSYALIAHKYWLDNTMFVAASDDNSTIYIKYTDEYSEPDVKNKEALATWETDPYGTGRWVIKIGNYCSGRTHAVLMSVIAAVNAGLYEDLAVKTDPLLFCDSCYYGYLYNNKDNFECLDTVDNTITDQAKRAFESGLINTVIGVSPFELSPFAPLPFEETVSFPSDLEPFVNGEKIIPYEWDDESKTKITDLSFLDDFVPTDVFYSLAQKIQFRLGKVIGRLNEGKEGKEAIGKDFLNIRFVGNPGSGKTVIGTALSAALGLPLYTVPIQKYTEEDTFEGKNKMVEGKLSFVQTDFLQAYKNGGIVVLEEINLADPALIMGALGQAIEPPFITNENGFNSVSRHPMCIIIATQNVGTVGSKAVNQALTSRFPHTYVINDPTEKEFVERLMTRFPDKNTCSWVYKSYKKIKDHLCSSEVSAEDIALALTFRACVGVLEDIEEGASRKAALKKFYAIIYGESPEIAAETQSIINSLPGI